MTEAAYWHHISLRIRVVCSEGCTVYQFVEYRFNDWSADSEALYEGRFWLRTFDLGLRTCDLWVKTKVTYWHQISLRIRVVWSKDNTIHHSVEYRFYDGSAESVALISVCGWSGATTVRFFIWHRKGYSESSLSRRSLNIVCILDVLFFWKIMCFQKISFGQKCSR